MQFIFPPCNGTTFSLNTGSADCYGPSWWQMTTFLCNSISFFFCGYTAEFFCRLNNAIPRFVQHCVIFTTCCWIHRRVNQKYCSLGKIKSVKSMYLYGNYYTWTVFTWFFLELRSSVGNLWWLARRTGRLSGMGLNPPRLPTYLPTMLVDRAWLSVFIMPLFQHKMVMNILLFCKCSCIIKKI